MKRWSGAPVTNVVANGDDPVGHPASKDFAATGLSSIWRVATWTRVRKGERCGLRQRLRRLGSCVVDLENHVDGELMCGEVDSRGQDAVNDADTEDVVR